MLDIFLNHDNLVFFAIFLSELLGTIVVFGSSAFFLPVAINYLSKNQSLGLLSVFQVFSNVPKLLYFFKKIDWKIVLYFGIPSIIMVAISSRLAIYVDGKLFKTLLGVVLITLLLLEFIKNINIPKNPITEFIGGVVSGFVSGLIGTGGAIRGYFIFNFKLSKEVLIATYTAIDCSGDVLRMFIYYYNGFIDGRVISYLPSAFLAVLAANVLGIMILKFIPVRFFNILLSIVLFVLATLLIIG
jgi:uncharacterized protein